MRKPVITLYLILITLGATAQDKSIEALEDKYDNLASEWLQISGDLKTYGGLAQYCYNSTYRENTATILQAIHHYDSVVLQNLEGTASLNYDSKEQKNTLKDLEKLEERYSVAAFGDHLMESCSFRREIEKNKKEEKNDFGAESYDGKILLLETELRKYLNHIDQLVLKMDDHLHMLHIQENQ